MKISGSVIRKVVRATAVAGVSVVLVAGSQLAFTPKADAYPFSSVDISGKGYGHGRGMSQYGSLGYAVDRGWSHSQILNHFYGGTSAGSNAGNPTIGVRLLASDNKDLILTSGASIRVGSLTHSGAVRIVRTGGNRFTVYTAGTCAGGGGWQNRGTQTGPVSITSSDTSPGDNYGRMLQRCEPSGERSYRGNFTVTESEGGLRAVNNVPVQSYLRGVVPRESPASWAGLGGGRGAQQLRAQSVAARSYVLAAANYSYATTCDTTSCQVYQGAAFRGVALEDSRTDSAISATAGQVRRFPGGAIARTEFSSSSGGYTAGGTFPAVEDAGDSYSGNPNHNWNVSLPVSRVEGAYPSIGSLQNIQITKRNGLGQWGGRVTEMRIVGSRSTVTVNGNDFRFKLGLKSDWIQLDGQASGGTNGYWLMGNDGGIFSFGSAQFKGSMGGKPLNQPIVGMTARPDTRGYWLVARDGGVFSFDASYRGSMGGKALNRPMVDIAAASNNSYWTVASDGGVFAFGDAKFYGSTGGQVINAPIVGMTRTPSGNGYWLVAADGGVFSYGDAGFHGSAGSIRLAQPVVDMVSTPSGKGYWLLAADGGVFSYGDAKYYGGLPDSQVAGGASAIARTKTGNGYMIIGNSGSVYSYGDAPRFGGIPNVVPGYNGGGRAIAPVY